MIYWLKLLRSLRKMKTRLNYASRTLLMSYFSWVLTNLNLLLTKSSKGILWSLRLSVWTSRARRTTRSSVLMISLTSWNSTSQLKLLVSYGWPLRTRLMLIRSSLRAQNYSLKLCSTPRFPLLLVTDWRAILEKICLSSNSTICSLISKTLSPSTGGETHSKLSSMS